MISSPRASDFKLLFNSISSFIAGNAALNPWKREKLVIFFSFSSESVGISSRSSSGIWVKILYAVLEELNLFLKNSEDEAYLEPYKLVGSDL
ncbi:hypothetical protein WICPIJ_002833 [Wickerhamomyces pijperi]|uniref:Uncharacterized protein n=1 Tax=Wickerhamomyces pijperi TaxID=599730 RepID=A0A9P8QB36_WICPI|nr:hypothetical protein WICPIJ_002833 [Wickerhamomyces pijperi]